VVPRQARERLGQGLRAIEAEKIADPDEDLAGLLERATPRLRACCVQ